MSSVRVTIETVRSGQPHAYADSVEEAYVLLETIPWNKPGEFKPWEIKGYMKDGKVEPIGLYNIPGVLSQYVPALRRPLRKDAEFMGSYLSYFGPDTSRGPGWYRYVVVSPFTD